MKIDIFTHISPPRYNETLSKIGVQNPRVNERSRTTHSPLSDVRSRFEFMDKFEDIVQVLTLAEPPIEQVTDSKKAVDLAKIANDELAELVSKHPDRFIAAAAALPMNNMDAALQEVDRAINDLKLRGVQIYTSVNEKPLDSPKFLPLYERMSQYDLPIWIHPVKKLGESDYLGEQGSKYGLAAVIGWPHATSMAMMRLACSGVLEKFPNLKFITHHAGGTVPYLAKRIEFAPLTYENLPKPITHYLRSFYYDTAVQGNTPNLMCAYAFCGADHMLFGTDSPMVGLSLLEDTIRSVHAMNIPEADKNKIFKENARQLLKLS